MNNNKIYIVVAFSHFDYEIKRNIGAFTSYSRAKSFIKQLDNYNLKITGNIEEIEFYYKIETFTLNSKDIKNYKYYIEKEGR